MEWAFVVAWHTTSRRPTCSQYIPRSRNGGKIYLKALGIPTNRKTTNENEIAKRRRLQRKSFRHGKIQTSLIPVNRKTLWINSIFTILNAVSLGFDSYIFLSIFSFPSIYNPYSPSYVITNTYACLPHESTLLVLYAWLQCPDIRMYKWELLILIFLKKSLL